MGFWDKVKRTFSPADDERSHFLQDARRIAEKIPGVRVVDVRPADLELVLHTDADGTSHNIFLGNMYAEMRDRTPQERLEKFERFLVDSLATTLVPEERWEEVREHLAPVIRGASSFYIGDKRADFLRRPFAPLLIESVVVDSAASMRYVTPADLARWGVSGDDVFAAARTTLANADDGVAAYKDKKATSPLWHVGTDDDYQSSRLLIPGWLASFEGKVRGRPIAIVPDRRTLIVGGAEDQALVLRLHALAEELARASPRHISMSAYTVDNEGAVIPFDAPDDGPIEAAVRHGAHLLAGTEYHTQKDYLNAVHERDGIERSFSTWGEGIDTLLPKTELIAMGSRAERGTPEYWLAVVPWADVSAVAGDCLAADSSCDPTRYRTVRWPDTVAVAELRRRAEALNP